MTVQELIDKLMAVSDKSVTAVVQVKCEYSDFYEARTVKERTYNGKSAIWIIDR